MAQKSWFLLHKNAPSHSLLVFKKYFAKHNVTALEYPSYSPDLSPLDYFLLPREKNLKGQ
jgi:hypothetical protein